jgi:hypothetical protein
MRWTAIAVMLVSFGVGAWPLQADLKAVRAEPDLGKRSKLALDNAGAMLKAVREAYNAGEKQKVSEAADEYVASVDLASESLKATGKDPRKSPKWFKLAEISTRDLLKRLDTLQHDLNFEDRSVLDKAKARTQEVHDDLLLGLMEGKKRK